MSTNRAADLARITLAGIRIANVSVALFAPSVLARQLGVGPREPQTVQYAFRLFGIRTRVSARATRRQRQRRHHDHAAQA